ncbi:hypothetical protein RHMOL_Rhmol06G0209100 [Rhododendron molle]|uniref:Uncharacterized protein n=1 Tax=Rhododendron molle TaxID=49168 RepID=A0ACC0NGL2_RHOML|nr:hypothetical protein RHMOL_Rhmol06G0209100 [Rhododendron molle]
MHTRSTDDIRDETNEAEPFSQGPSEQPAQEPNANAQRFYDLLKDAKQPLYEVVLECFSVTSLQSKFLILENSPVSEAIKRYTLKLLRTRLRDWRCTLKNKYFDQTKTAAQIVATAPPTVNREHFADLVSYWFSDEGKAKIKELLPNSLEGNSKGSIYWSLNDVYSQAINKKEWSGRVRGCGFGPTPKSSRSTRNDFPRFNVADEEEKMRDKQTIRELQNKVQSQAAEMSNLKEQMAIVMRHNGLQLAAAAVFYVYCVLYIMWVKL